MRLREVSVFIIAAFLVIAGCGTDKDELPTEVKTITIVECGECQYQEGNKCTDYKCCEDSDCYDDNSSTEDICLYSKTKQATCYNQPLGECARDAECDDKLDYTKDICSGSPKICSNTKITDCINNDYYCPTGCNQNTDNDCEVQEYVLTSDFFKNEDIAQEIISGERTDYSINEAVAEQEPGYEIKLKPDTFAFRFVMGLGQLGYNFVQDTSDPSFYERGYHLNVFYKFLRDNGFEEGDVITKEIMATLDSQVADLEKVDKENYKKLKQLVDLEEIDVGYVNYPSKVHYYSLQYNFLINLPERLRKFDNKILGGNGSDAFVSNTVSWFYPSEDTKMFEHWLLNTECATMDTFAHEWGHNIDFEILVPENSEEVDPRFTYFGLPIYKTDPSLDFYSISWSSNNEHINNAFLSSYAASMSTDPNYPQQAEDFAETFAMYIMNGRVFRALAEDDPILQEKYDWMKENVFEGVEYDTGNENFPDYISPSLGTDYRYYQHTSVYSLKDVDYRCTPIKRLER